MSLISTTKSGRDPTTHQCVILCTAPSKKTREPPTQHPTKFLLAHKRITHKNMITPMNLITPSTMTSRIGTMLLPPEPGASHEVNLKSTTQETAQQDPKFIPQVRDSNQQSCGHRDIETSQDPTTTLESKRLPDAVCKL
jgi:hypothetical protein